MNLRFTICDLRAEHLSADGSCGRNQKEDGEWQMARGEGTGCSGIGLAVGWMIFNVFGLYSAVQWAVPVPSRRKISLFKFSASRCVSNTSRVLQTRIPCGPPPADSAHRGARYFSRAGGVIKNIGNEN
jgi:hypothetical protein